MSGLELPPQSRPIKTLDELRRWAPNSESKMWNAASYLLPDEFILPKNRPLTLVCHDYKGGYLEDSYPQGVAAADAYRFFHWAYVDIFVYFSHHLITTPPPCWINAAHKHSTLILGTFITEWDAGARVCNEFLESEENYLYMANTLVSVAENLGFDGWLVNIENRIEEAKVPNLVKFLQQLTYKMHRSQPNSLVIWYDSVTMDGDLKWQDELNDKNKRFFDSCDGIYLNYNWNDEKLLLSSSMGAADVRPFDVYAGIDVFGRGTPGGGGFNSKEALQMVRKHNLSVAIFAQGWVDEVMGKRNFTENEYKFWAELMPWITPRTYATLPFYTSFCQGQGEQHFQLGKVIDKSPWTNLSLQNRQPFNPLLGDGAVTYWTSDAYNGGGCLRYYGDKTNNHPELRGNMPIKIRLFDFEYDYNAYEPRVFILYTFKNRDPTSDHFLDVTGYKDRMGHKTATFRLVGEEAQAEIDSDRVVYVHSRSSWSDLPFQLESLMEKHMEEGRETGWSTRCFVLEQQEIFMPTDIHLGFFPSNTHDLLLGQLLVTRLAELHPETAVAKFVIREKGDIMWEESNTQTISTLLQWKTDPVDQVSHYNVFYAERCATDTAKPERYKLFGSCVPTEMLEQKVRFLMHDLKVDTEKVECISVKIQPVWISGCCYALDQVPVLDVPLGDIPEDSDSD